MTFWVSFVVVTASCALTILIRLKNRTLQPRIAELAPAVTVLAIVLTALVVWLVVKHRYRPAVLVGLLDSVVIAVAAYGWLLRSKVEDKWQTWY